LEDPFGKAPKQRPRPEGGAQNPSAQIKKGEPRPPGQARVKKGKNARRNLRAAETRSGERHGYGGASRFAAQKAVA